MKFLALSSQFQHLPLAAKCAQNKLVGLQDLWTPGVFQCSNTKVLDEFGAVVDIDLAPHVIDRLCRRFFYLTFDWHIWPTHINMACKGKAESLPVTIFLPRTNNRFIRIPLHLLDVTQYLIENDTVTFDHFFMIQVHPDGPNRVSHNDNAPWVLLDKVQYKALFHILAYELQSEFIGKLVKKELTHTLHNCCMWVQQGAKPTKLSVNEHYQKFSACVNLLDMAIPFICNLPSTYFDSLDQDLKAIIESKGYELPPTMSNNTLQLTQLQELWYKAVLAEKDMATQMSLVLRACQVYGSGPPTQTFHICTAEDHSIPTGPTHPMYNTLDFLPPVFPASTYPTTDFPHHAFQHCFHVYHSIAETALQEAYGKQCNQVQCYGCAEVYPEDCFHQFLECPWRNDPRVQQAALPKLEQFLQWKHHRQPIRRDDEGLSLEQQIVTWKRDGFQSQAVANFIYSMAAAHTTTDHDQIQWDFWCISSDALYATKDHQHLSTQDPSNVLTFAVQAMSKEFCGHITASTKKARFTPTHDLCSHLQTPYITDSLHEQRKQPT